MNRNCKCKRLIGPSGLWKLENLIGAHVRVSSMPVSNFAALDTDQIFEVEKVEFRISLDGKAITVVILKGLPDMIFTLKDIMFVCLNVKEEENNEESNIGE